MDEFLAALPDEARRTLERLRKTIHAAAPGAVEAISYGIPAFKLEGRPLVGFGAGKGHCALYVIRRTIRWVHAPRSRDDLNGHAHPPRESARRDGVESAQ